MKSTSSKSAPSDCSPEPSHEEMVPRAGHPARSPEKCPWCVGNGYFAIPICGFVKVFDCKRCKGTGLLNAEREAPANEGRLSGSGPLGEAKGSH